MYSTGNESKVVVAERFVRTLKDKIYKETTVDDSKYDLHFWISW